MILFMTHCCYNRSFTDPIKCYSVMRTSTPVHGFSCYSGEESACLSAAVVCDEVCQLEEVKTVCIHIVANNYLIQ